MKPLKLFLCLREVNAPTKSNPLTYLQTLLKDPFVASVTPTSRAAVKRLCRKINFRTTFTAVEYGAGLGVFAIYMLQQMNATSSLVLIERNEEFCRFLKSIDDPRLTVYQDTAENVRSILENQELPEVDYIISGLPFSMLTPEQRENVLDASHKALKRGGKFLVYQVFNHLHQRLKAHFRNVDVEYELLNLPPLCIYEAIK